jgi:hypothetical protein
MEVLAYGFAAGVILLAYFVRGISGFGSGLIAVPLLAQVFPLIQVVPFVLLLDVTGSVILGRANRRLVAWKELKPLLPGSAVGVGVGATLLMNLDRQALLATLGTVVILFALRNLLSLGGSEPVSRWWALPASLVGGTVSALFGTGGPPYVIYLSHRIRDKSVFRATTSLLFVIDGGLRIVVFLATGILTAATFAAYAAALPLMALGLWLGSRVHVGISNAQMMRLIGLLLLGSGASLLWKALA